MRSDPVAALVRRYPTVRRRIAVDARSLAALRIALGGIVLVDLFARAGTFAFYTGSGPYPPAVHEALYGAAGTASLHALSGAPAYQAALFFLAACAAVAFAAGYRTTASGVLTLALLVSLHVRNPLVLNGGDRLLRVLLLVALLAPLGERWGLDAPERPRAAVASVGTVALLAQPLAVFGTNAIWKARGETWYAGEALVVALADTTMATALGRALADVPALLSVLTYAWVGLLAGALPLLLLSSGWVRAAVVAAYLAAFAGMAATLSVGLFPAVLAASVLPFVPGCVWDRLAGALPRSVGAVLRRPAEPGGSADGDEKRQLRRSLSTLLAVAVLSWMLLFAAVGPVISDPPGALGSEHLDQQDWGLYAPDPGGAYDWHAVEVRFADGGRAFDPAGGTFDRPPDAGSAYRGFRHRRFLWSVAAAGNESALAPSFARWACERAASEGEPTAVTLYRFRQAKPEDGRYPPPERRAVLTRDCEGSENESGVGRSARSSVGGPAVIDYAV